MLSPSEYYNELKCFSVELIKSLGTFQLLFADVGKQKIHNAYKIPFLYI